MKNFILKLGLLVVSLLTVQPVFAFDFSVGGLYYNIRSERNATVGLTHGDTKYSGDVSIPETVLYNSKTYKVISIENYAFGDCSGLRSVTIPNSVTTIENSAFGRCEGLTSVTIPNSVSSIGDYAFSSCEGLTSVTIPNSVTSIGNHAFSSCKGLTSVTIPNSVSSIGEGAFDYCTGLVSIAIGNSVTTIGPKAFFDCTKLTEISVDKNNPSYCSVGGILYDKNISTLICCPGATVSMTIPNSVTSIGDNAFGWCRGLTSMTIPNSVTSIGTNGFAFCSGLKSLIIGNSVTSIGNWAFMDCSGLTTLTIPNSVTSIGDYAFRQCGGLTEISVGKDNPSYCSVDGVLYNKDVSTIICCPPAISSISIPNSVTSIEVGAFADCRKLTSLTIPNSVDTIWGEAFRYCTELTSITIPNSVTFLGGGAFSYCSALTSVTIPNSITSIKSTTFLSCSNLTSITIPKSITSIDWWAFYDCSELSSVYCLPSTPPDANADAFSDEISTESTLYVPLGSKTAYEAVAPWNKFYKIVETDFASVEDVLSQENEVYVTVRDGRIIIENYPCDATIRVYNPGGALVAEQNGPAVAGLAKGVYIVSVAGRSFKVAL